MVIVMFPCYDARFWFQAHLVVETEPYFMLILRWIRLLFDLFSQCAIIETSDAATSSRPFYGLPGLFITS